MQRSSPMSQRFMSIFLDEIRIFLEEPLNGTIMSFIETPIASNATTAPRILIQTGHTRQRQLARFVAPLKFTRKRDAHATGFEATTSHEISGLHGFDPATCRQGNITPTSKPCIGTIPLRLAVPQQNQCGNTSTAVVARMSGKDGITSTGTGGLYRQ